MKITVVGCGYVGLSIAVLLSQKHEVTALDVVQEKVDLINNKISPIKDADISHYLKYKNLNLTATTDKKKAYENAEIVFICVPTDYDETKGEFNTLCIENAIIDILQNSNKVNIVCIKSTIPIGYTSSYKIKSIVFSPEFLREGHALHDNLYPSRIIVGGDKTNSKIIADILKECCLDIYPPVLLTSNTEAEAIKLFSNTYLAGRVAFFNEVDSYCMANNLDAQNIIEGICLDKRIGHGYNNPSFGYGGYCFPKDTKQLLSHFEDVPQDIISAIVHSNQTRKEFIIDTILYRNPKVVGIYRLNMKEGSDNCRDSASADILKILRSHNIKCIVYEPSIPFCVDLKHFKQQSDIIIANRNHKDLSDVQHKVFTRDIFGEN